MTKPALSGGGDVRQQRHEPGALDRPGEHALLHGRGAGALARQDLAVAADHLLQRLGVLVIDVGLAAGAGARDLDLGAVERLELFRPLPPLAGLASGHTFNSNSYRIL